MNLYGFMSDIKALAGMLFGMNPKSVITYSAVECVDYGKGLFMANGGVSNKKNDNKAELDVSTYTAASKDIIATINGTAVTTLTTTGTIATDVVTLVALINDEIEGVTATAITGNKILVQSLDGKAVDVKLSYDGSDVTSTKVTASSDFVFVGVALFHQTSFEKSVGYYAEKEAVACLEDGYVWVKLDSDVTPKDGDTAYVNANGVFTTSSSGNTLCGKFKSGAENGLALVNINK